MRVVLEEALFGPVWLLVISAIVYGLARREGSLKRWSVRCGIALPLLIAFFASGPVSALIAWPLLVEVPSEVPPRSDAVVAISGGLTIFQLPNVSSSNRVACAVQLYQQGVAGKLVLTGGWKGDYTAAGRSAALLAGVLGVRDSSMLVTGGFTTFGEAASAREILRRNGIQEIVLVTSPIHLRRAAAVWRRQGFSVRPWTWARPSNAGRPILSWSNLAEIRAAAHEIAGIAVYWARGQI